jgi:hypothetical protein
MERERASGTLVAIAVALAADGTSEAGTLSFQDASAGLQTPTMEGGRTELEFADLNLDGHLDIVSIGDHGSPFINSPQHGVMVWFGDGTGQWSIVQVGDFGYGGVAVGDVNGDGLPDVGYGMHHNYSGTDLGDQLLEVALGDGTGAAWIPWDDGLATSGETWGMFGTDFADVDADGDLDIGSISFGCCAGIHVYLNHGDGTWSQSFGFLGGNSAMEFAFGDVNGDGRADFAASHGSGTVYLGDGAGGFAPADSNLPLGPWRRGVSLGDVNGDGRDDLAFATSSGVQVWSWANGSWQDHSGSLATAGDTDLTQIADMDLDGHGDVVAFRPDLVRVFRGDGAAGWALAASINTPDACGYAALRAGRDADHNGMPDIAIVSEENCQPFVGGTNRPRFYAETSAPREPFIHPVWPRGGETIVAGSVRFLGWHAAVPGGGAGGPVSIELSVQGPGGPWETIASGLPNNGCYQWHVPPATPTSSACHLRLRQQESGASAVTPQPFAILGASSPDIDGNGVVNIVDLLALLGSWGECGRPCPPSCPGDLDGDCAVAITDLLALLAAWGPL